MKFYGQLEEAQLENIDGNPANLPDGRVWLDKTADKAKFYDGTATRSVVTENSTQTLTNKTIDADANTITNIENADIKAAAAIAVNKLAVVTASRALVSDGSGFISPATTTSTEIGYVNGVTSAIQTQLDAKQARSTLTTKGDLYVATASATVARQGVGSDGQVLTADSAQTNGVIWATPAASPIFVAPTIQAFTSGSGTYNKMYAFLISSGNATAGDTYTNNAVTFTVHKTVSSATLVYMSGSGAPASSGTLTRTSGSGDATLTFSANLAPVYLRVRMVGGGGGGGGTGVSGGPSGSTGGTSSFNSITTIGGNGGGGVTTTNGGAGGNGGTGGTGTAEIRIAGSAGEIGPGTIAGTSSGAGGGGRSILGFGGAQPAAGAAGNAGQNNGGGGSGGGGTAGSTGTPGGGGGGEYLELLIASPSATYSYAVGAGGAGGVGTGTNAKTGGAGAAGYVEVTEYYR